MPYVEIKYVEDKKRRREAYKKRTKSLKKLTYELSQLCDIPVLMICYGQDGDVVTWPQDKQEIDQIAEKFRKCTSYPKHKRHNLYNFRSTKRMKEYIKAAIVQAREMPTEKVNELTQSMESKLKEIRERVGFLTPQSNQDSNDNAVEESIIEEETLNNSAKSQGRDQPYTFDLNEPVVVENDQDGIYEETKQYANKGKTFVKSNDEDGSVVFAIPSMEEDENRIARMKHHSIAMEAFNWHRTSMNYWASQLYMYHNSDSCNLNHSLSFAPPSPESFAVPIPLREEHNRGTMMPSLPMLMPHGMRYKNRDIVNGNYTETNI